MRLALALLAVVACSNGVAGPAPECGTFRLGQGESGVSTGAGCLQRALDERRVASLVVERPTLEGDPVTTTYTTRADGRVEVVTDARKDHYGGGVETRVCAGPVPATLGFVDCG